VYRSDLRKFNKTRLGGSNVTATW